MNRSIKLAGLATGLAMGLAFAVPASAQISGTVYQGISDAQAADASVIPPSTLAHADFTASAINFNTNDSTSTSISDFLNNPIFTNTANGFDPNGITNNVFLVLTGQAYLLGGDNSFVVGHDDGVVLTFPGLNGGVPVVNEPLPTSFSSSPFTVNNPGAAGLFAFSLQYTECCGGPANLVFTINGAPPTGSVPEPASWAMMIAGFGLVGGALRNRRKTTVSFAG